MPSKTQPTAAELRAQLAQREAEEADLDARRRAARRQAEIDTARKLLDERAEELSAASSAANDAWIQAIDDPSILHDELLSRWQAKRLASAARARFVAQLSARLGQLEPRRHPDSGVQVPWRMDTNDYMEPRGQLAFSAALEEVLARRADNAARAVEREALAALQEAGDKAAAEIE